MPSDPATLRHLAPDVAALYIDPRGPYPKIPGVDCYDEERNAEMFPGGMPVVAHPPCGPWGNMSHRATSDDPALALLAVQIVQECGGVLEQPARSKLWKACGLPRPGEPADAHGGYTVEVEQVRWGHVARKRTWLYCVRVPELALEVPAPREPTKWISGTRKRSPDRGTTPAHMGFCSMPQRRRTPPDFARYLVKLARSVKR